MDTGEQFAGVVGLDHVVVGAEVQAVDPGADVRPRGHHDHRAAAHPPDPATDLEAVLVGQAEVEQDHPKGLPAAGQQGLERLLAVAGVGDVEAVPGQHGGQGGRDMVVVLHEQQPHRPPPHVVCPAAHTWTRGCIGVHPYAGAYGSRAVTERPKGIYGDGRHARQGGIPEGPVPLCSRYTGAPVRAPRARRVCLRGRIVMLKSRSDVMTLVAGRY